MDKKVLRKELITKRDSLDIAIRKTNDELIFSNLLSEGFLDKYDNIFCYVSFGSEIDTTPILEYILEKGKNLYVPYIDKSTKTMKLALIKDLKKDLEPGFYGILEPKKSVRNEVDNNIIDLVVTPGVAFTKDKYRMGYGGGFYDRFFASLNDSPLKVSMAYDFQIVDELPVEVYDIPVDVIITQNQSIK